MILFRFLKIERIQGMIITIRMVLYGFCLALLLTACGGGSGGGSGGSAPASTKAVLEVSTDHVPVGTLVGGVQAAFTLPPGTFLAADPVTGNVNSGVVTLSGVANGSLSVATYNPTSRMVSFGIVNASPGFGNGKILTINVSIAAGATVKASDFPAAAATTPSPLQIIDVVNLNSIPEATCPISVTLQ
jgi:hypothetical protein